MLPSTIFQQTVTLYQDLSIAYLSFPCHRCCVSDILSQNEILNSTVRLCGGIYSNTVDIYYFI